jgi:hypothetical protein
MIQFADFIDCGTIPSLFFSMVILLTFYTKFFIAFYTGKFEESYEKLFNHLFS